MPAVATSAKPACASAAATGGSASLSRSCTERNAVPEVGSSVPAPRYDLSSASPNVAPSPITSPVDFISGPRIGSSPGKRTKGKTGRLIATSGERGGSTTPSSRSFRPSITFVAIRASGSPVALATNGTVREARGLTSSTKIFPFWIANWMLTSPRTPSASASRRVSARTSSSSSRTARWYGGSTQALSPEWIPASSMCCITAATTTSSPSQSASTSSSKASSRKRSSSTGCSGEAATACFIIDSSESSSQQTNIARPPSTYDGRTSSGKPISRAARRASSKLRAVPQRGASTPSWARSAPNRRRSSARSMLSGEVPRIFTPRRSSGIASDSGVCPPNCTITPSGFSLSTTSSTSSSVSGSK